MNKYLIFFGFMIVLGGCSLGSGEVLDGQAPQTRTPSASNPEGSKDITPGPDSEDTNPAQQANVITVENASQLSEIARWNLADFDNLALALSFSLDGSYIALGYAEGPIKILDAADGSLFRTLEGYLDYTPFEIKFTRSDDTQKLNLLPITDTLTAAFISPDFESGVIQRYDVSSGRVLDTFIFYIRLPFSLDFSHDSKFFVYSEGSGYVHVMKTSNGHSTLALKRGGRAVSISPSGELLASSDGVTTLLWHPIYGQILDTISNPLEGLVTTSLTFSPDGDMLAISANPQISTSQDHFQPAQIYVWNLKESRIMQTFELDAYAEDIVFSPNGDILAAVDSSGALRLWDAAEGDLLNTLGGSSDHTGVNIFPHNKILFSPDGRRVIYLESIPGQSLVLRLFGVGDFVSDN